MDNINKYLESWLNQLNYFSYRNYEDKPDIELYMEQLVNYLEKEQQIFQTSSLDKQITNSMINNYVKGEVVPAPISKRYNREHIAALEEVCTLKNVLTISEVKQILDQRYKNHTAKGEIFNEFNESYTNKIQEAVKESFIKLNQLDTNDLDGLINMALDFSLTANTYMAIAKRILFLTRIYQFDQQQKEERTYEQEY
jgi:DNA-binding transcriptional MerR regulator